MTTTTPATCRYAVGQRVQVLRTDFTTPGFPEVWMDATVAEVEPSGDIWEVAVRIDRELDRDGEPLWHRQLVGKRGGNKRIRPA